jgi:hypothetical protein
VIINSKSIREIWHPLLILALIGLLLNVGFSWMPGRSKFMEAAIAMYLFFKTIEFFRKSNRSDVYGLMD